MRDIFYNPTHEIGSHDWLIILTEAERTEWNWIQNNIDKVNKVIGWKPEVDVLEWIKG